MLSSIRCVAASVVLCAVAGAVDAQTGRYFVTDESGVNNVWQFQSGALVNTWPTLPPGPRMGPIVVDGNTNTVRYAAGGMVGGQTGPGWEHDFAGTPVAGPLSLTLPPFAGGGQVGRVIDAGFDGQSAYVVAWSGHVLRYNGDFSGPGAFVFNAISASIDERPQGITYDTLTNTIWTSDYNLSGGIGFVRQWSLAGVQLTAFPVTNPAGVNSERNTALAYDQNDDTFWLNAHVENTLGFGLGELWQFDRAGNFLQAINATPGQNLLYWGGEIRLIPAPGAVALLGLASVVGARRRRA
ncbi:MAG TPA: hypothetical protein VD971_00165 [Phycisphaerales bacterium]|nr:hypothetical protein [Phycisphaerales bacterium]